MEANAGGLARNIGMRQARTAAIAFAEVGSGWAPGSLDRANRLIHRHPRLAVVSGPTRVGANGFSRAGATRAAVLRRDALLSVGGFPGAAHHAAAEVRLARRLARAGWRLAYCVDVVAWCDSEPRAGRVVVRRQ